MPSRSSSIAHNSSGRQDILPEIVAEGNEEIRLRYPDLPEYSIRQRIDEDKGRRAYSMKQRRQYHSLKLEGRRRGVGREYGARGRKTTRMIPGTGLAEDSFAAIALNDRRSCLLSECLIFMRPIQALEAYSRGMCKAPVELGLLDLLERWFRDAICTGTKIQWLSLIRNIPLCTNKN